MLNICNIFSKLKIFRFYSLQIQILEIYAEYFSKLNSKKHRLNRVEMNRVKKIGFFLNRVKLRKLDVLLSD